MLLYFYKYHGSGNDFIILDNRSGEYNYLTERHIKKLCDRHFGIGADGLMLLNNGKAGFHFDMEYFNNDGKTSSMCGNGGRCITAFAMSKGIISDYALFTAIDGEHEATIDDDYVELKMKDVLNIKKINNSFELDTGSPHYVQYVDDLKNFDVVTQGKKTRDTYGDKGINVNFIQILADKTLMVRTYERGVENETLSCGTGVTAAALVHVQNSSGTNYIRISTLGGTLMVKCVNLGKEGFQDIWLCGQANFVYQGSIEI